MCQEKQLTSYSRSQKLSLAIIHSVILGLWWAKLDFLIVSHNLNVKKINTLYQRHRNQLDSMGRIRIYLVLQLFMLQSDSNITDTKSGSYG